MKSLTKQDFINDYFEVYINQYVDIKSQQNILLAYRLSKYAQFNRHRNKKYLKRPIKAVMSLVEIINTTNPTDIISLLLYYVIHNSYLLTFNDIKHIFANQESSKIIKLIKQLIEIEDIVNAKSALTKNKLQKYKKLFNKKLIKIKAAEVIGQLNTIDFSNESSYFKKVHKKYLPIFDMYDNIGDIVALKLRKIVFQKLSYAKKQQKKGVIMIYNNVTDLFLIMNDIRFKNGNKTSNCN